MIRTAPTARNIYVSCRCERISEQQQHFSNIPRFTRLQKIEKLRTHEEDSSDIGTREIREIDTRSPMDKVPETSNWLVDLGMC